MMIATKSLAVIHGTVSVVQRSRAGRRIMDSCKLCCSDPMEEEDRQMGKEKEQRPGKEQRTAKVAGQGHSEGLWKTE